MIFNFECCTVEGQTFQGKYLCLKISSTGITAYEKVDICALNAATQPTCLKDPSSSRAVLDYN